MDLQGSAFSLSLGIFFRDRKLEMDPMEQNEEEMRRKEEESQRDLEETIGLGDFFAGKDLTTRGKTVRPSGKQVKELQTIAPTLKIRDSRRRSGGDLTYDLLKPIDFDLLGTPRIFITSGPINRREPGELSFLSLSHAHKIQLESFGRSQEGICFFSTMSCS
jgi:hypothetical protein